MNSGFALFKSKRDIYDKNASLFLEYGSSGQLGEKGDLFKALPLGL